MNAVNFSYQLDHASRRIHQGFLIDGGANGGMSRCDGFSLEQTMHHADVSGLTEHTVTNLSIITAAGVLTSSPGPIIGNFHQYAHLGSAKNIHSTNKVLFPRDDATCLPKMLLLFCSNYFTFSLSIQYATAPFLIFYMRFLHVSSNKFYTILK
jgi:hypothetical protein